MFQLFKNAINERSHQFYLNCSCVHAQLETPHWGGQVRTGKCTPENCTLRLLVYLISAFLYMFLRFVAYPPHQVVYLR